MTFDISTYLQPHKNLVIELSDDVQYQLDAEAVTDIQSNKEETFLIRLIDGKKIHAKTADIIDSLTKKGAVDYL